VLTGVRAAEFCVSYHLGLAHPVAVKLKKSSTTKITRLPRLVLLIGITLREPDKQLTNANV